MGKKRASNAPSDAPRDETSAPKDSPTDEANAELFMSSYLKLLRAHGEAYPGACADADALEAAWNAEKKAAGLAPDATDA